jgi:hypothetical protein
MQSLLFDFYCSEAAPFFGFMGVTSALVFASKFIRKTIFSIQ